MGGLAGMPTLRQKLTESIDVSSESWFPSATARASSAVSPARQDRVLLLGQGHAFLGIPSAPITIYPLPPTLEPLKLLRIIVGK